MDERKATHLQRKKYNFPEDFFFFNGANQMWCNLSQSKSCHIVRGRREPNQRRGNFSPPLTLRRAPLFFLLHKTETLKVIINLPVYARSRESRQPWRERKNWKMRGVVWKKAECAIMSAHILGWISFGPRDRHQFQFKSAQFRIRFYLNPITSSKPGAHPMSFEVEAMNSVFSWVPLKRWRPGLESGRLGKWFQKWKWGCRGE